MASGTSTGTVRVQAPALGINQNFHIQSGRLSLNAPVSLMQSSNNTIERKAIHIVSSTDISVNVIMNGGYVHEGFLALPVHDESKRFVIATTKAPGGAKQPAEFLIAALRDSTSINMTFPDNYTGAHIPGNKLSVTLNAHQTYQFQSMYDLTGTIIESSAPVSVVAGNSYTWMVANAKYGSFLAEQMPSIEYFGNHFTIPPMYGRTKVVLKVLAPVANVNVTLQNSTGTFRFTINNGLPLELTDNNELIYLSSNQPIMVAVLSLDSSLELSGMGGEFMWVVPSIANFMDRYDVYIPSSQAVFSNSLFIVAPTSGVSNIRLGSAPLPISSALHTASVNTTQGSYTAYTFRINSGKYSITSTSSNTKFGALLSGDHMGRGYGFALGMKTTSKGN